MSWAWVSFIAFSVSNRFGVQGLPDDRLAAGRDFGVVHLKKEREAFAQCGHFCVKLLSFGANVAAENVSRNVEDGCCEVGAGFIQFPLQLPGVTRLHVFVIGIVSDLIRRDLLVSSHQAVAAPKG